MLEKIVMLYRKAEMGIISQFAGTTANVLDETSFYDAGFMQAQICRIQTEIDKITNEIRINAELNADSDYAQNKRKELMEERERLLHRMIFLGSNSFKNLPDCIQIAEGHEFPFMRCIQGLQEFASGQKEKSFQTLQNYYGDYGSVEGHFLANKVFALLLLENGREKKAIPFFTYALQFVPDDSECLKGLEQCYRYAGDINRESVVKEILEVLG